MQLWTAFLVGLVGSLHCAGMCGPLTLAIPGSGNSRFSFVVGRCAYNSGRLLTYCLLGALFGALGRSFAVIGLQRWVSLAIGVLLLAGVLLSFGHVASVKAAQMVGILKTEFGKLLRHRTVSGTFLLGVLNGLLPCGLVYAACAGAAASSGVISGTAYMLAFGAGTVPMMVAIGIAGKKIQFALRFKLQHLVPVTLLVMSALLILRGLALGIPYLSPDLTHGSCCHH